jgi:hypothetical protein
MWAKAHGGIRIGKAGVPRAHALRGGTLTDEYSKRYFSPCIYASDNLEEVRWQIRYAGLWIWDCVNPGYP